jgi:hypothetical protein
MIGQIRTRNAIRAFELIAGLIVLRLVRASPYRAAASNSRIWRPDT